MLVPIIFTSALIASLNHFDLTITSNTSLLLFSLAVRKWPHIHGFLQHVPTTWLILAVFTLLVYRFTTGIQSSGKPQNDGPKVLFLPSETAHIRFFPQRHAFNYSYLLAGVPVGFKGSLGGIISVDEESVGLDNRKKAKTWFSVDAEDYLARGHGHLGLKVKLDRFLLSEGQDPKEYPYAYLFTAPKFLGYFNNPVSFWYLYNHERVMTAMILEVNNTFEERRMYFLPPGSNSHAIDAAMDGSVASTNFSQMWAKDFHVSPFSSRKGFYTIKTHDPLAPSMLNIGNLSATITLLSSDSKPKLVARIFSAGLPFDPATMTRLDKFKFIMTWWWIGYLTFPRVAFQAAKLWFNRGLHVWARPEPYKTTISRTASASEATLENFFLMYLEHLVAQCARPLRVTYIPSGIKNATATTLSSPACTTATPTMEIKALAPIFYTRFIHYAHDLEAFFSESTESNTLHINSSEQLPLLVLKKPSRSPTTIVSIVDHTLFKIIRVLRQRPPALAAVSYIGKKADANEVEKAKNAPSVQKSGDLRSFRNSSMDAFFSQQSHKERREYAWEVAKVLIADRVAFGDVSILWFEMFVIRSVSIFMLIRLLPI